jgi:RNA polymerase sigma-70 factor (ECF subfamily)
MTDADYRQLLQAIALRDSSSEQAMATLYRDLHGSVFAFVRRRWGPVDDHRVQAVVVDALYEVWRSAARFTGDSLVKTWVLGIARHKLLDAVRQDHLAPPQDDIEDHADTLQDDAASVFDQLADKQRVRWLATCMEKLPTEQRECLHLLLVEALSVEEIAGIQGCAGGTVKSRLFHAKRKLRDCMATWLQQEAPGHNPAEIDTNLNELSRPAGRLT